MQNVNEWFILNKLSFNVKKRNFQFFIELVGEIIYHLCYQSFLSIISNKKTVVYKIPWHSPHHHHYIFVFLEDIMQSTVFIQVFLSSQIFSRILRSFSCSPDRLMLEYLEMSFRIRLSHVVFSLPVDIFRVFTKAFSDLLAGVSEGKRSR